MHPSRSPRRRRTVPAAFSLAAVLAVLLPAAAPAATPNGLRDVLVVSNNWAGTADVIDVKTSKRLKRLNVVPDKAERIAQIQADQTATFYFDGIRQLVGDGHDQFVDDGFASKDGRLIYFSRPSFADVVAIDVATNRIRWRVPVEGYRADHMGLSPDGRRLLVSASTASKVHVIDTARGRIIGSFASGYAPHENNFSRDGRTIFHANLGTPYTDTDDFSQDEGKGVRYFELVDARTLRVRTRIEMGKELARYGLNVNGAVRPMAIAPDEKTMFFQLSFVHGFVEWDLAGDAPQADHGPAVQRRQPAHAAPAVHPGLRAPRAHLRQRRAQAVRRGHDVQLRGDRAAQHADGPAHDPRRGQALLVDDQPRRALLLRLGERQRPRVGHRLPHRARGPADPRGRPPAADAHRLRAGGCRGLSRGPSLRRAGCAR